VSQPRFIADTMLGTLARKLRLLGVDSSYFSGVENGELKYRARSQSRILLTKDTTLARTLGESAWLVSGDNVKEEFLSITERLAPFSDDIVPLSRCLDCNEPLITIDISEAVGKVPPYILTSKTHFSKCFSCGKVFWEGTHSESMGEEVKWMRGVLEEERRGRGEEGKR